MSKFLANLVIYGSSCEKLSLVAAKDKPKQKEMRSKMRNTLIATLAIVSSLIFLQEVVGEKGELANTPKLIGKWKSNVEKTMAFNEKYAKLEPEQLLALKQVYGNSTIEFVDRKCIVHSPALSILRDDKLIDLDESTETFPYTVLGATEDAIAITIEDKIHKVRAIIVLHFENDYMWMYVGDSPLGLGTLHVREYFQRMKEE